MLESLDNGVLLSHSLLFLCLWFTFLSGKTFSWSYNVDLPSSINCIHYYTSWADKNSGQIIETEETKVKEDKEDKEDKETKEAGGRQGEILAMAIPAT